MDYKSQKGQHNFDIRSWDKDSLFNDGEEQYVPDWSESVINFL